MKGVVFDLYGPDELAEMEAAGVGACPPRPLPLPVDPVKFPGDGHAGFAETLAGAYERGGFPNCAAGVREIIREARA